MQRLSEHSNSKCPVTGTDSFFMVHIITPIKKKIGDMIEGRETFTTKYWIKYLNLINKRNENLDEYSKVDINALYDYCEKWELLYQYCIDNWYSFDQVSRWIESDLSMIIWENLMNHIHSIDISKFNPISSTNLWESLEFVKDEFDIIIMHTLKNINDFDNGHMLLELCKKISQELWENSAISNRLIELIFVGWVWNTVMKVADYIDNITIKWKEIDKDRVIELILNSKKFISSIALTNTPLFYIKQLDRKKILDFNSKDLTINYNLSKKTFQSSVNSSKINFKQESGWELSWCPLLFKKWKVNWKKENWIIAYEIKIAELLCDLMNKQIDLKK